LNSSFNGFLDNLRLFRLAFWTFARMIAASMTSEGTESTRTLEFLAWLEVNKKGLAIGLAMVVVIGSAIATVQWMGREKQRQASIALLELQLRNTTDSSSQEASASDYQALASEHAGTHAAARAQLLAAELLFRDGNFEEARQAFERAGTLLQDDALKAGATYGVAASLDSLGRSDEAQQIYQQVTVQHAAAAVAGQARLALAGLFEEKGDLAQALRSYSELTNVIGSPWGDQARDRHKELLLRHPELAPPGESSPEPVAADAEISVVPSTNAPAAE
jgi:tetratricopeptide (TPR) repeat protein